MANPQLENGYCKLSNEIIDKLCSYRMPGSATAVLWTVIRLTYGFNSKENTITLQAFVDRTGMTKDVICRTIGTLVKHQVITRTGSDYALQKDIDRWIPFEYPQGGDKRKAIGNHANKCEICNHANKSLATTPKVIGNHANPATDLIKDNIKDNNKNKDIGLSPTICNHANDDLEKNMQTVFNAWNAEKIIVHRQMTDLMRKYLKRALNNHTVDEIIEAIVNYGGILNSPRYYWKFRWTLAEFCQRGIERFIDGDAARENFLAENKNRKPAPPARRKPLYQQEYYPGDRY